MSDWKDARGAWADAFPDGIDSVEIVRCNRNGWEYEDYIRLRDMGVEPEDIAAIAKRIAELEAKVTRLQKYIGDLSDEVYQMAGDYDYGFRITEAAERADLHPGDLDPIT